MERDGRVLHSTDAPTRILRGREGEAEHDGLQGLRTPLYCDMALQQPNLDTGADGSSSADGEHCGMGQTTLSTFREPLRRWNSLQRELPCLDPPTPFIFVCLFCCRTIKRDYSVGYGGFEGWGVDSCTTCLPCRRRIREQHPLGDFLDGESFLLHQQRVQQEDADGSYLHFRLGLDAFDEHSERYITMDYWTDSDSDDSLADD